jgi:hypothetical protein
MADWGKISPERFEQLCTEILQSEGFYNIRRLGKTGDKGRDILAQKQSSLLFGSNETQNWVIQCKRYVSSNLTIVDVGEELNKVRMHNIDYYAIILTNTLNPNLHDWLESVKKQYPFKILLFDIDWLEGQLKRLPILYQTYFEDKERNPAFQSIQNTDLQVYTAGQMPSKAIRGEITWWRKELEKESSKLSKKIGFYHPEFSGCDHTGIYLSETVQEDFRMISQSNLVIVYLERDELYGTIAEIMIGYSMFKQIAIFIDESIKTKIISDESRKDFSDTLSYYEEVYQKVFKTNHSCPCDLMNELEPIHLNNYWFIIQFLRLRQPDTHIQMTSKETAIKDMISYLKKFTK